MVKKKKVVCDGQLPQDFGPTSKPEVRLGQLVRSKAGRDKEQHYLVCGREGDTLYLADGRTRPVENPKKKNIRHVQRCNRVAADQVAEAVGRQLRNEEVRAGLRKLLGE